MNPLAWTKTQPGMSAFFESWEGGCARVREGPWSATQQWRSALLGRFVLGSACFRHIAACAHLLVADAAPGLGQRLARLERARLHWDSHHAPLFVRVREEHVLDLALDGLVCRATASR